MSDESAEVRHLILLVEESDSSLGLYDSQDGTEAGRIALGLWPHEVEVSADGRTAYVTNFGLRDYDLTLGYAGNSISVIDIPSRTEAHRIYTDTPDHTYWGPHGVKLSPDGTRLYVNVERTVGLRTPDPTVAPGQERTQMLVYEVATRTLLHAFAMPRSRVEEPGDEPGHSYGVPQGSHNFLFGPDGRMWIFSGRGGVSALDPHTGAINLHLTAFNGAVRGLALTSKQQLLVSATNQVSLVDPATGKLTFQIDDLGVTQLLYSQATPDARHILAPAVWEGQVVVIDVEKRQVVRRIQTGVDPVHVLVAPHGKTAYVTHGRSHWASEIDLSTFEIRRRIATRGGPNGVAVAAWSKASARRELKLGVCLPFTGEFAAEGRELRLGYEFWKDRVNASGGVSVGGTAHQVSIDFADTESSYDLAAVQKCADTLVTSGTLHGVLGSYPAEADAALAQWAGSRQLPFVTGTGWCERLKQLGLPQTFAINSAETNDLGAVLDLLWRRVSPKPRTAAILSCSTDAKREAAAALGNALRARGLDVVSPKGAGAFEYTHGAQDFAALVAQLQQTSPDLVFVLGHRVETTVVLRAMQTGHVTPGAIVADFGITFPTFRATPDLCLQGLTGVVQWSAQLHNCAHDRFVSAGDFARLYFMEYSEAPSSLAAAGAACGVVYEKAFNRARSTASEAVCGALRAIDRPTFFGHVRFEDGLNVAKESIVVQLRMGPPEIGDVLVWPPADGSETFAWPFRAR